MIQLLEPVSPVHILDGAIVSTEAEELLPQLQHRQVLHHVPKNCSTWVKNVDCWTSHCRAKPWVHVGARWPASRQSGILCNPSFLYLKTKLSSEPVQPIFGSNIATGETSQVITSRHFSSLLFTSMSIITSLVLINWKANKSLLCISIPEKYISHKSDEQYFLAQYLCISSQLMPFALIGYLATRWRHLY